MSDTYPTSPLRSISDIIAAFEQPIEPQHLKQKTRGGQKLDFIPWYHAIKYLDRHAPGWAYSIQHVSWNIEGRLVLVARISIPCLEGVVSREATGTEEEPEEGERMYGDPSSNAESMALRRAAAKFGLGLYLYDKDRDKQPRQEQARSSQTRQQVAGSNKPAAAANNAIEGKPAQAKPATATALEIEAAAKELVEAGLAVKETDYYKVGSAKAPVKVTKHKTNGLLQCAAHPARVNKTDPICAHIKAVELYARSVKPA